MSSIGDLNIRIDAVINPLLKSLNKAERSLRATGERMSRIGGDLAMNVSLPLAAIGAASIKAAGNMEQMKNGLASMMGSAEAASAELVKLQEIAKLPGINLNQAIAGSLRLQAVGLSADQARKSMTSFSNALTLAGGNSEDLAGVTLALMQIVSKGKVFAEEINQIAERVPQVRKAMMNIWGTADTEALQKMGISTEDFITKVTDELAKLPKATGGINNAIDNTGQAITMFLANLGEDINKTFDVTGIVTEFADSLAYAAEWFKNLDSGTKKTILSIGAFTVVLGPAIKLLGLFQLTMAAGVGALSNLGKGLVWVKTQAFAAVAALNAMTLAQLAFTAGIAGLVAGGLYLSYKQLTKSISDASRAMEVMNQVSRDATMLAGDEVRELTRLKETLNDETASRDAKNAALNRLKEIQPSIYGGYNLENLSLSKLNGTIDNNIKLIQAQARAEAANAKIRELTYKQDELRDKLAQKGQEKFRIFGSLGLSANMMFGETRGQIEQEIQAIDKLILKLGETSKESYNTAAALNSAFSGKVVKSGITSNSSVKTGGGSAKGSAAPTDAIQFTSEEIWGKDQEVNVQWERSLEQLGALKVKTDELKSSTDELNKAKDDTLLADKGIAEQIPVNIGAMEAQIKMVEKLKTAYQGAATFQEAALNSMQQIGGILMDTMSQTGKSFKEMALEATGAILKVVKVLLMQAVAQQIVNSMISSGGNPFVALAVGAIAGAGVGILFNTLTSALGIPALAEGGLAYAPQLAMVGDNKNASTDPEVIAPLSKLKGIIGGMGGNVQVAGAFTGSEMRLLNEREARNRGRIRGF